MKSLVLDMFLIPLRKRNRDGKSSGKSRDVIRIWEWKKNRWWLNDNRN